MNQNPCSPPQSPPDSPLSTSPSSMTSSKRTTPPLTLDLSSLPPLITPSPPSNTLLLTNLNKHQTFHPTTLQHLRTLLSTPTPLNSFSPLPSFHRIIISYPTTAACINMRQILSSVPLGPDENNVKIYFGGHTPVAGEEDGPERLLQPPKLGKLLFISPPPSPPMGWEIREEEPPNRDVHAEDLERALRGLEDKAGLGDNEEAGAAMSEEEKEGLEQFQHGGFGRRGRSGTGSLMVYHPRDHGGKGDLPKVMVEDTEGGDVYVDGEGEGGGKLFTHTARPPVELMEGA